MPLSHNETKYFIDLVLNTNSNDVRVRLYEELSNNDHSMPEFYDGVIQHGPFMNYTSEQWFDFHLKVPHWRLRDESSLMNKLSPHMREQLT